MKAIKYFLMMVAASVAFASCEPNQDCPEIRFDLKQLEVAAEGGDLIIKVTSTGIDDVLIDLDNFQRDENGNLKPGEEWITLNEVIYNYDENATRDLPLYISGIDITVAPNTTGKTRTARIYATSYNKTETIEIVQAAE
ncbi:MAG: BACON domain-containing protein [Alistipes sp.]|nr:BACON domain-containing protein [Alistipes sp.]